MFIKEPDLFKLYRLSDDVERLRGNFMNLTQAAEHFSHNYRRRFPALSCTYDESAEAVIANLYGTQVRFVFRPTLSETGQAQGTVVCFHELRAPGESRFLPIGSFTFDTSGVTDLPANEGESIPTMYGDADAIVLYFVNMAMQSWRQAVSTHS